ncbi:MAG: hybrid sensor histidine kinase/response regulator transcription factor, partial [Bacteroidales bacterium]|nr:hybrid sensor histidine kinase/response regulator transcription factor [Bacteroidales bacterium]
LINSELLVNTQTKNYLELTNFQLFNKDVKIGAENSPLNKSISIIDNIKLKHYQSSFSIAYSALDFQDPKKTQYAYILEGFDNEWNYVGNQTKASYTNLPKGSYTFKVKSTSRDGKWSPTIKTVNIVISPVWWDTTLAYIAYVILLLTAVFISRNVILKINNYRNQLTIEKQVNELKLRFFTNISHEIRTPLTLILAPLEDILRDNNTCKEVKGQLEIMKKNTQRMLKLVNELLDFRRIQHKKMTLNISKVDLNLFTSNIYKSFLPLAKHNGITLKYSNNVNDLWIWADLSKIDTILYNLISNAIKYTPRGKNVNISANYLSKTNEALISIRDEGIGMDNENMEDLFTRFFMLNQNENGSSGIGLSLAYELAKLHYGDIKVSSQKGVGSTFNFHIPMDNKKLLKAENVLISDHTIGAKAQMYEETYDYDNSEIIPVPKKMDQACILIVEDNKDIAEYLKRSFSKSYNCLVANNGIQGLELAAKNNPDAIISDIMMPQMDGIEMTKQLKDDFALCHIPVVMMTAKTEIEDKREGYNVGAEVYITKPLDIAHLKAVINNLINQRQLIFSKYKEGENINASTLNITSKDEGFLTELIAYVEKNYTEELSVESLAEHFCVSRTVLYNKIKGLTGISPLEFMRHIRLKISKTLLENGYSVAESAFNIGYSDVKYFSKQFKLFFGYPPSKVKKDK